MALEGGPLMRLREACRAVSSTSRCPRPAALRASPACGPHLLLRRRLKLHGRRLGLGRDLRGRRLGLDLGDRLRLDRPTAPRRTRERPAGAPSRPAARGPRARGSRRRAEPARRAAGSAPLRPRAPGCRGHLGVPRTPASSPRAARAGLDGLDHHLQLALAALDLEEASFELRLERRGRARRDPSSSARASSALRSVASRRFSSASRRTSAISRSARVDSESNDPANAATPSMDDAAGDPHRIHVEPRLYPPCGDFTPASDRQARGSTFRRRAPAALQRGRGRRSAHGRRTQLAHEARVVHPRARRAPCDTASFLADLWVVLGGKRVPELHSLVAQALDLLMYLADCSHGVENVDPSASVQPRSSENPSRRAGPRRARNSAPARGER